MNFIQFWPLWLILSYYKFVLIEHYDFKTPLIHTELFLLSSAYIVLREAFPFLFHHQFSFTLDSLLLKTYGITEYLILTRNMLSACGDTFTIKCHCLLSYSFVVYMKKIRNIFQIIRKVGHIITFVILEDQRFYSLSRTNIY